MARLAIVALMTAGHLSNKHLGILKNKIYYSQGLEGTLHAQVTQHGEDIGRGREQDLGLCLY